MAHALVYLTPLALWLASGVLSTLLAKRTQIDHWCEARPRVAGLLKLVRGFGLDPWQVVQGVALIVKGALPVKLQAAKILAAQDAAERGIRVPPKVLAEVAKQSVPPPPTKPPPLACFALMVLALGLLARCTEAKAPAAPCSPEALAEIQGEYVTKAAVACKGKTPATCDALPALKQERDARVAQWVQCPSPSQ